MSQRAIAMLLIAAGVAAGVLGVAWGVQQDAPSASAAIEGDSPAPLPVSGVHAGTGATDATTIIWVPYDDAFSQAAREHKPVLVVFSAPWCGHCRTYSEHVLSDGSVIAASRRFVMVRVNIDERRDLNARHNVDGGYVPRTMFFTADGAHRPELRAVSRAEYSYFLDTTSPAQLLSLMGQALGS